MRNETSQRELIKAHLLKGGIMTQDKALSESFNKCWRLSSVILRLRKEGLPIVTRLIENGNCSKHAEYFIKMD